MMRMTARQALEWVYAQTIAEEMAADELAAAFSALTGQAPRAAAGPVELFRRLREIVLADDLAATPVVVPSRPFGRRL